MAWPKEPSAYCSNLNSILITISSAGKADAARVGGGGYHCIRVISHMTGTLGKSLHYCEPQFFH